MRHSFLLGIILALAIIALVACSTTPTSTPTPIPPIPTLTVMPPSTSPTLIPASTPTPTSTPMPTPTPIGGGQGRIAFVSNRDGNHEIYVMNADGSTVQRLTDDPADDTSPAWSPDSRHIAFVSNRYGNKDILLMNANGSNVQRLTDDPADDTNPAWSPDGKEIIFSSVRNGTTGIYAFELGGSSRVLCSDKVLDGLEIFWSPKRDKIVFFRDRAKNDYAVYWANIDCSQLTLVSSGVLPGWSSDNTTIAYISLDPLALQIAPIDSSSSRNVTQSLPYEGKGSFDAPRWSPNGSQIALPFLGNDENGNQDLYITDFNGSKLSNLRKIAKAESEIVWSPDGKRLVFVVKSKDKSDIYMINADGTGQINLTNGSGTNFSPQWQP